MNDFRPSRVLVPKGSHICMLYDREEERLQLLREFILEGIQNREKIVYLAESENSKKISDLINSVDSESTIHLRTQQIVLTSGEKIYLKNGKFETQDTLEKLKDLVEQAESEGWKGLRVTGEGTKLCTCAGVASLTLYEMELNKLIKEKPFVALCQYNMNEIDPRIQKRAIQLHPWCTVENDVIRNPYYVPHHVLVSENEEEINESKSVSKGLLETMRNKTKELYESEKRMHEEAKERTRLLANVHHELRTPALGLLGMAELLLHTGLSEEQKEYVTTLQQCGKHLLNMWNDILDFAQYQEHKINLEIHPFNLSTAIRNSIDMCKQKCREKNLSIECKIAPDVCNEVLGDETKLKRILVNLIGNAAKFTEQGGIEVTCETKEATDKRDKDTIECHVSIKDTGIGFSKEQKVKLFRSFSQLDSSTKRKYGGTGLGLMISKQLVERMDGNIDARSDGIGKGSTFSFHVLLQKNTLIPFGVKLDENIPALTGKRLLLLEESIREKNTILEHSKCWGMETLSVNSFDEMLDTLLQYRPDIIVVDKLMLPSNRTWEQKVEESGANVIYSMYPNMARSIYGETLPISVIMKPTRQKELLESFLQVTELSNQNSEPARKKRKVSKDLRVLVAEDNDLNRKIIVRLLQKAGIENVKCAKEGKEAISLCRDNIFDIILMDLNMPEMDGVESTSILRERFGVHCPPIIAITASVSYQKTYEKMGFDGFLGKPFQLSDLEAIIQKFLKN